MSGAPQSALSHCSRDVPDPRSPGSRVSTGNAPRPDGLPAGQAPRPSVDMARGAPRGECDERQWAGSPRRGDPCRGSPHRHPRHHLRHFLFGDRLFRPARALSPARNRHCAVQRHGPEHADRARLVLSRHDRSAAGHDGGDPGARRRAVRRRAGAHSRRRASLRDRRRHARCRGAIDRRRADGARPLPSRAAGPLHSLSGGGRLPGGDRMAADQGRDRLHDRHAGPTRHAG